ncbi:hypothetical protein [Elizabethkingia anophelis]|uniref:hypothetical protein n=1 Tax=Elizabethkingia anophelis TaxID=1117645 RepID=UPI00301D23F7
MTNEELTETLKKHITNGNCFTTEVRTILIAYKNAGGHQENAKTLLETLAIESSADELLQDRTYDILDIVTGWCSPEMRVWQ